MYWVRDLLAIIFRWWIVSLLSLSEHPKLKYYLGRLYLGTRKAAFDLESSRLKHFYQIDQSVKLDGSFFQGEGQIIIGEQTYFGINCFVMSNPKSAKIQIGRHCAISHNVHIRTESYHSDGSFADALTASDRPSKNIEIGNYVWIGANVFIRGGVSIGSNSVIGANSVVTSDVPENAIVGGVPATIIRYKRGV